MDVLRRSPMVVFEVIGRRFGHDVRAFMIAVRREWVDVSVSPTRTLVWAAGNNDIELLLGCSVVAVFVVLVTQLISDIGYVFLNPRIRMA